MTFEPADFGHVILEHGFKAIHDLIGFPYVRRRLSRRKIAIQETVSPSERRGK
jgi:hypothetical protein